MKKQEKMRAIELRKEGKSVGVIAKEIGVSKGSVSYWVRDVPLTDEQRMRLDHEQRQGLVGKNHGNQQAIARRMAAQTEGRRTACDCTREYVTGCMLFWAEGSKSGTSVIFTNTDEDMVLVFVRFLKRYFGCVGEDFSLRLNAYLDNGLSACDLEKFWVDKLGLTKECFRKSVFKRGDGRGGKYPHGVCTVMVHSVDVVQKLYGSIQELIGVEKEGWLKLR